MRAYTHSVDVADAYVSIGSSTITLPIDSEGTQLEHKFLDGEEVVYTTEGNPIGITSTNVGFSTNRLISSGNYFIAKIDHKTFRLAITKDRALSKTKLIEFNALGTKGHTFRSAKIRKIIDELVVTETGSDYINRNVVVDAQNYPPTDKKNLFNIFSGINIPENTIYARNHGFNDKDLINYTPNGTSIGGLTPYEQFYVIKEDNDSFKLANASTIDGVYENHKKKLSSGELGRNINKFNNSPELISNGDFSGTTGWTVGTGWTISGHKATHTGAAAGYLTSTPLTPFIEGRWYVLTADVSAGVSFPYQS